MIRICPKCDREIDYLINYATGTTEYCLSLDTQEDIQYEAGEFEPDVENEDYWCPECDEVLFIKETEAIAFLKGE